MRHDIRIEIVGQIEMPDMRRWWEKYLLRRPKPKPVPEYLAIVQFEDGFFVSTPITQGLLDDAAFDLNAFLLQAALDVRRRQGLDGS